MRSACVFGDPNHEQDPECNPYDRSPTYSEHVVFSVPDPSRCDMPHMTGASFGRYASGEGFVRTDGTYSEHEGAAYDTIAPYVDGKAVQEFETVKAAKGKFTVLIFGANTGKHSIKVVSGSGEKEAQESDDSVEVVVP